MTPYVGYPLSDQKLMCQIYIDPMRIINGIEQFEFMLVF